MFRRWSARCRRSGSGGALGPLIVRYRSGRAAFSGRGRLVVGRVLREIRQRCRRRRWGRVFLGRRGGWGVFWRSCARGASCASREPF